MELKEIKKVMGKYGKAWDTQNTELLVSCFTKNGIYQESPLSKPHKGHKKIRAFWDDVVGKKTKNIKFKLGECYLSKNSKTGFAEWECRCYHRTKEGEWRKDRMVGIMILKMKGDKITYLNEYWNTKRGNTK